MYNGIPTKEKMMTKKIENAIKLLESSGFKITKKLMQMGIGTRFSENATNVGKMLYMDCESTGLNVETDEVIEVGMVLVSYNKDTNELIEILDCYNGLNEPTIAISEDAFKTHGITLEMLKGHSFDYAKVNELILACEFGCAHNANFDRKILERYFEDLKNIKFGCSYKDVDWEINSNKLDYILYRAGYDFDGHRAVQDCYAAIFALNMKNSQGKTFLSDVIAGLEKVDIDIVASGSPYSSKEILKGNGYQWNGDKKYWYKPVQENEVFMELDFLKNRIYDVKEVHSKATIITNSSVEKYSNRSGKVELVEIFL